MQRKNQLLALTPIWSKNLIFLTNVLPFLLCLFFTTQSLAAVNAKGIQIEFLQNDLTGEEPTAVAPIADEAAPLELSLSPSIESNLWSRIQTGYEMPNIVSPYTAKYEDLYAARPDYVAQMMSRSQKYLFYVVEEVENRGMPMEIALLPMIESAYNPKAISRSKAVGIWQFMPATGKHFGLKQNWWADHRRDVIASTNAALSYLEKLHGMFGSWDLALAAYNAGEGTVGRAIKQNQKVGLGTDYQSLTLPLETMHYVPKLQAIKNIVTNPQQYGLNIESIPNTPYFAKVDAPSQIDAKLAATLAEISNKEFALLNPRFNRPLVASRSSSHQLLLPVNAVERFQNNLNNHNQSLTSWKVYSAKRGENINSIAKKFKIRSSKLRKINSLPKDKKLSKTFHLLVPKGKTKSNKINISKLVNQKTITKRKKAKRVTHKIRRGETLSALAKRYGTNTRTLMKINRLKSTKLKIGQIIRVKGKKRKAKTKRI